VAYDKQAKVKLKAFRQQQEEDLQRLIAERQKEKEARSYDNLMVEENMESNVEARAAGKNIEEDFM